MDKFYKIFNLKPVINVAGTMTSIGASIINKTSLKSVEIIHDKFIYIDQLQNLASQKISKRLKTEAAMITASSSSALTESIAAIYSKDDLNKIYSLPKMNGKKSVLVQKGHLVNYGGEVEQAIKLSGANIITTGKKISCSEENLKNSIEKNRKKILCALYVLSHHCDEYNSLDFKIFYKVCSKYKIPVILDAASESNMNYLSKFGDISIFSAHKFMGGLTAGIIAGKKELIRFINLQNLGIGRGFKAGKESILSSIFAIEDWYHRDHKKINKNFDRIIYYWKKNIEKFQDLFSCEIIKDPTGNPINRLRLIPKKNINAQSLALALEDNNPSIIVRDDLLHLGYFELDPCNLHKDQEKIVLKIFSKLLTKPKFKKISLKEYKKIKMKRVKNWI
jgi:L-seryl-tRNA(Ser) seleniumtransferase